MAEKKLFEQFPPVSTEQWNEAIIKDLKGADYAKKMIWQSPDGLAVKPYYRAEDLQGLEYLSAAPGAFPYSRSTHATGGWRIRETIEEATISQANQEALTAVKAGAEEIAFKGLKIASDADLKSLVAGITVPVHFTGADASLVKLVLAAGIKATTDLCPLCDAAVAAEIAKSAPAGAKLFVIDAASFEEAGATAPEEVGFALAAGVEALNKLIEAGVAADKAASHIAFEFAIGSSYFFQVAKLRAFRAVWAKAVESFGASKEAAKATVYARTSRWNKTIYDAYNNVLRATTEAMSAVIGGADVVSVAPFDECFKAPDEPSRRLARNTQLVIKKEAHLDVVADPAGGSYAIENLTNYVATEAWKKLQELEAEGGFLKAKSKVDAALAASLAARKKAIAQRRKVYTGTNQFANLNEKVLDSLDLKRVEGYTRGTAAFEALRLTTERAAKKTGSSPLFILAEIGDLKMRAARSGFAANFFGCAGFNLKTQRFASIDEIVAFDAAVIVLCSSDAEYLPFVEELMPKLKAAGKNVPVIVAGAPETTEQLAAAGVADFIHVRSNVLETLAKWQKQLGIEG